MRHYVFCLFLAVFFAPFALIAQDEPAPPGPLCGIGAVVGTDKDGAVVKQLLPHGTALGSGLKVGDIIVAIDDKSLAGMKLIDVVNLIRGPEGTHIKVTVSRGGAPLSFTVYRAQISLGP